MIAQTAEPIPIIGGVGGIGEALARQLRAHGQTVVITARDLERAQALAGEIGASALVGDVLEEASLAAAVVAAAPTGQLGGLVYAVGSITLKPLARTTSEDMLAAFKLNVVGAMAAVRLATEPLKAARGSVVLFSSVAASQGFPMHTAIGTAKAAVEGLTLSLAAELAPTIRVNAIAPSLTQPLSPRASPTASPWPMALPHCIRSRDLAPPGWRWLGRLVMLPFVLPLAELAYKAFLRGRPALQRLWRWWFQAAPCTP